MEVLATITCPTCKTVFQVLKAPLRLVDEHGWTCPYCTEILTDDGEVFEEEDIRRWPRSDTK